MNNIIFLGSKVENIELNAYNDTKNFKPIICKTV